MAGVPFLEESLVIGGVYRDELVVFFGVWKERRDFAGEFDLVDLRGDVDFVFFSSAD